jgi:hypothetical protein
MNGYKDPTKETLSDGTPIASAVRGSRGMKGVIISPAAVDGRSTGFNPHDKSTISINIEPDSGNGQTLSLSQFTKEAVRAALKTAEDKIPGSDIHAIRERAALAFEELAKINNSGVVKKVAAHTAPPVSRPAPAAETASLPPPGSSPDGEPVDRTYSPMAAFGLKKGKAAAQSQAVPAKAAKEVGPPTKLLYFEKEGIGTVPAFFHDVVVEVNFDDSALIETGFIVLVYDLRYEQATARWFPPANDPYQRPWALQINNDRRLYLVQTTGFQYVYDDREFCVLAVEKAVTADI